MDDLFAKFIAEEFEYMYSDEDRINYIVENLDDGEIAFKTFYQHFDAFKNQVVNMTSNDEWLTQQIHDRMDDMLIDAMMRYFINIKNK